MAEDAPTVSLTSFVGELALAWQKLAIYQEGHPARDHAVGRAHSVLVRLIAPAGTLSLGVSQGGLLGPEEKLTSGAASRLAAALYLREVAVIRFEEGVEAAELEQLLELLPHRGVYQKDRLLADDLADCGVSHVIVETVDFTGLVATDSLDSAEEERPESLWDRIIQRLLNDQRLAAVRAIRQEPGEGSLAKLLALINAVMERYGAEREEVPRPGATLERDEIMSALAGLIGRAIGDQTTEDADPEARRSTARHVTELLAALPEGLGEGALDSAMRKLVTNEGTAPGLLSLASAVSAAQMVGSLRRLRIDKISFSPALVSLLESLIAGAEPKAFGRELSREPESRARELRRIFADEDVDRVGPAAGFDERLFLDLRHHVPIHSRFADLDPYLDTLTRERETVLLSVTLANLLSQSVFGEGQVGWIVRQQEETFRSMLADGRLLTAARTVEAVVDLAANAPEESVREAAERCLEAFRQGETLATIVDSIGEMPVSSIPSFHRLIGLLGESAIRQLFLVLGDETDMSRRRRIFDLLASLGSAVAPAAVSLLDDPRWYMTRNILSLLRQVGATIDLKVFLKGIGHDDARVRHEAVKCIPELERNISPGLVERILEDPDPKVAEAAVGIFGRARIATASEPLVSLLQRPDPLGRHKKLRLKALTALGELGDPQVLPQIGRFFRSWFAVVSNEERHAAFESLRYYPEAARRPWLRKGRRALDATVRQICRQMEAAGSEEGARKE